MHEDLDWELFKLQRQREQLEDQLMPWAKSAYKKRRWTRLLHSILLAARASVILTGVLFLLALVFLHWKLGWAFSRQMLGISVRALFSIAWKFYILWFLLESFPKRKVKLDIAACQDLLDKQKWLSNRFLPALLRVKEKKVN